MDEMGEVIMLLRKLYLENSELKSKVELLESKVKSLSNENEGLQKARDTLTRQADTRKYTGPRYHDPEDRSWRAWPSNDAAE